MDRCSTPPRAPIHADPHRSTAPQMRVQGRLRRPGHRSTPIHSDPHRSTPVHGPASRFGSTGRPSAPIHADPHRSAPIQQPAGAPPPPRPAHRSTHCSRPGGSSSAPPLLPSCFQQWRPQRAAWSGAWPGPRRRPGGRSGMRSSAGGARRRGRRRPRAPRRAGCTRRRFAPATVRAGLGAHCGSRGASAPGLPPVLTQARHDSGGNGRGPWRASMYESRLYPHLRC